MTKPTLVAVVGPTAVGKTKTSIELAKTFAGEIVNCDSMQIYREMDIGTAKIKPDEMEGIPHHLFDICMPDEEYSVAEYQHDANEVIDEIHGRNHLPIMVGGTGLYVRAVAHNYQFDETPRNPDYREELEKYVDDCGADALHDRLTKVDSERAKQIHPNNTRRVIRALEIFQMTGSAFSSKHEPESPFNLALVGLTMERDLLYERINHRVDLMVEEGLFDEVKKLYEANIQNTQSVQAIGYKEIYRYFDGGYSREKAIETLKRNSRRYAKRQLTWFRHQLDVEWFDMTTTPDEKIPSILRFVAGKLSL
ncbi:tRNA (adenosine(37)-N6)-dimethylallyltransferase MiaA [Alkalihalobacillus sp. AL-G]|uniref:tRNA (adenosine(37)-N6)-dimethylallyltransferase MiaA n=1 Tax=Alkalihalobacillus sp. AL-G TaxID=2926399 RepID=UPI00272BAEA1|nr:tRNA (adenosine(37)-N6)-dimethylallyltransferase MiaA [Alkalihalobacillus sp. AL-G]WLD95236.1 tRNA (adenosine(37)-N6)-dimethylallyltransferase MiaA [Alkalihalobacillus sp. AL-G]